MSTNKKQEDTVAEVFGAIAVGGLAALLVIAFFFAAPFLFPLLGAFSGWILSLTPVGAWIVSGFQALGFTAITVNALPYIGAMLGFIKMGFAGMQVNTNKK